MKLQIYCDFGNLIQIAGSCVNQILHCGHSFDAYSSQYHLKTFAVCVKKSGFDPRDFSNVPTPQDLWSVVKMLTLSDN